MAALLTHVDIADTARRDSSTTRGLRVTPLTAWSNELTQDSPKSQSTSRAANSPGKPPQSVPTNWSSMKRQSSLPHEADSRRAARLSVESASKSSGKTPGSAASVARSSSLSTKTEAPSAIWLAPEQAESRLVTRIEPQYPADAIPDHLSGDVGAPFRHPVRDGAVLPWRPAGDLKAPRKTSWWRPTGWS